VSSETDEFVEVELSALEARLMTAAACYVAACSVAITDDPSAEQATTKRACLLELVASVFDVVDAEDAFKDLEGADGEPSN
jgi:hypothetical protein